MLYHAVSVLKASQALLQVKRLIRRHPRVLLCYFLNQIIDETDFADVGHTCCY